MSSKISPQGLIFVSDTMDSPFPSELKMSKLVLEYLICSEYKTHPTAALTTLLTLASTITARKYYTETNASTTLFLTLVAATGSGKNIVFKAPSNILKQIGYDRTIVTSKISSIGAMDDIFLEQNVMVQLLDEFGDHLGGMLNDKGGYLKAVAAKMKNLYSLTDGIYEPNRYSSSGGKSSTREHWTRINPCYGVTGVTTQAQLLKHLTEDMIQDGFLNRFIILNGNNIPSIFPKEVFHSVPNELIEHLQSLEKNNFKNDEISKIIIPMSSEAREYYDNFIGDADIPHTDIYKFCLNDETEIKRDISVRWRENSIRLATALSAFEKLDKVSLEVLKWAYSFVQSSSLSFVKMFENNANETKYQQLKNKAINWFKSHSEEYYSLSYLSRSARPFKGINRKDRQELLEDLIDSEIIEHKSNVNNGKKEDLFKLKVAS